MTYLYGIVTSRPTPEAGASPAWSGLPFSTTWAGSDDSSKVVLRAADPSMQSNLANSGTTNLA